MENLMKKWSDKFITAKVLAFLALCMAMAAANSRCMFIFHQPKVPNEVKKLRKF